MFMTWVFRDAMNHA